MEHDDMFSHYVYYINNEPLNLSKRLYGYKKFFISKLEDEWYTVSVYSELSCLGQYKCDQFNGLIEVLEKYLPKI